ncbi:hypothetical protein [Streptomyces sp900129855]|uniref:Transcriptional regulator n=1 Tax=Streptomyces sp. 900129855 TaxID=3155129 RepID=A0ABV2ZZA1_9ACTN
MTGRSMAQLGFRTGPAATALPVASATSGPPEESDSVERRHFLLDGAGVVLGLPIGTDEKAPGKIGASQVRAVTKAVATLYEKDHDHGSATVRQAASRALHTAYQWLQNGTCSTKTETKLRSAVGALSIAAGWLSYDSGRAGDAHSLYGEALAAARVADDPELEAHAFGCLSLLAKAQGRPREAIAAAQGAQTVARNFGSPRLLSLFHMREAGGWALAGDASATDRAIVKAHHLYSQGPADADPLWLGFYAPGELAGLESLARADLGQHERAAVGAEQAVLLHGGAFARNSALYPADIAIQHAVRDRPEPEAAAEAAGKVLAFLPEVRSDRAAAVAARRRGRTPETQPRARGCRLDRGARPSPPEEDGRDPHPHRRRDPHLRTRPGRAAGRHDRRHLGGRSSGDRGHPRRCHRRPVRARAAPPGPLTRRTPP